MPTAQTITQIWNATANPTSGTVAATNVSYNATIAAGATTGFGFLGSWTETFGKPTAFTVNNTACTVR